MSGPAISAPYPLTLRFGAGALAAGVAAAVASGLLFGEPGLALAFVALWAAIAGTRLGAHGRPTLGLPTQVTVVRAAVSGLVAGLALRPELDWLLPCLAALALGLDWLDGYLARRLDQVSSFGGWADQELDALFIVVLSLGCWQAGRAGPWILLAGAYRYAFLAAARLHPPLARPLAPRRSRAWACGWVIAAMLAALVPVVPADLAQLACAAGLAVLTWSFAVDLKQGV